MSELNESPEHDPEEVSYGSLADDLLKDSGEELSLAADNLEQVRELVYSLAQSRQELGLSQAAVAERMGTSQAAVAKLEKFQHEPRLGTVARYATAIGFRLLLHAQPLRPEAAATRVAGRPDAVELPTSGRAPIGALLQSWRGALDRYAATGPASRQHSVRGLLKPPTVKYVDLTNWSSLRESDLDGVDVLVAQTGDAGDPFVFLNRVVRRADAPADAVEEAAESDGWLIQEAHNSSVRLMYEDAEQDPAPSIIEAPDADDIKVFRRVGKRSSGGVK